MGSCCRVVFSFLALCTPFSLTWAFDISTPPPTVSSGQKVPIKWFRNFPIFDPTHFQFALFTAADKRLLRNIGDPISSFLSQGDFTVTFSDQDGQVILGANFPDFPRAPPFLDSHTITVTVAPATQPPPPLTPPTNPNVPPTSISAPAQSSSVPPSTSAAQTGSGAQSSIIQVTGPNPSSTTVVTAGTSTATAGAPAGTGGPPATPSSSSPGTTVEGTAAGKPNSLPPPSDPVQTSTQPEQTTNNSLPINSPHPSNTGVILGVTLGILALIILLLLVVCIHRRNRRRKRPIPDRIEAFYREQMKKSEENIPELAEPRFQPLRYTRASLISDTTTVHDAGNRTYHNSKDPSSGAGNRHAPDNTVYTISEYGHSDSASTTEQNAFVPRTDRQMNIEQKIFRLQEQLVKVLDQRSRPMDDPPSRPVSIGEIREQIKRLRVLQEGDWAREISDEAPMEIYNY